MVNRSFSNQTALHAITNRGLFVTQNQIQRLVRMDITQCWGSGSSNTRRGRSEDTKRRRKFRRAIDRDDTSAGEAAWQARPGRMHGRSLRAYRTGNPWIELGWSPAATQVGCRVFRDRRSERVDERGQLRWAEAGSGVESTLPATGHQQSAGDGRESESRIRSGSRSMGRMEHLLVHGPVTKRGTV